MLVPVTDSKALSQSELFVLTKEPVILDSRFRPPLTSNKHKFHLCKGMPTMCRPDLEAPDPHWSVGILANLIHVVGFWQILIHVVFNCLDTSVKLFADRTHCNQEESFPLEKTCCVVSMICSNLQ